MQVALQMVMASELDDEKCVSKTGELLIIQCKFILNNGAGFYADNSISLVKGHAAKCRFFHSSLFLAVWR